MDVKNLGQVFTEEFIVKKMFLLKKNNGSILEPSCGDGSFLKDLKEHNYVSIEIDERYCPENSLNIDFFDYSVNNKFDTIIGNPPYVSNKDILKSTKSKLSYNIMDKRSNLYLFFIEKCIRHLKDRGELILITPRGFINSTSARKLNKIMYESGTITHFFDLGDEKVFEKHTPNCAIFRYEKGNFNRNCITNNEVVKKIIENDGQLLFTNEQYTIKFNDLFSVKVGASSGANSIFKSKNGNMEFVCSDTCKNGKLTKFLFNVQHEQLIPYKSLLINRKGSKFNDKNWFTWARKHYISDKKRIYVNCKTRNKKPFFINDCNNYDGAILAIFPKFNLSDEDLIEICGLLNLVNWEDLGFICGGRFLFSQKALENTLLPDSFSKFILK